MIKCRFCLYETKKASDIKTHLNRKKRCNNSINELEFNDFITYINTHFSKTKPKTIPEQNTVINTETNYIISNNENSTVNVDNSKTENITNITNNYFVLMPYNKPNLTYIKDAHIKHFLKSPPNALANLLKHIHYNKDRKENWNIFAPGKTPDYGYLMAPTGARLVVFRNSNDRLCFSFPLDKMKRIFVSFPKIPMKIRNK